MSQADLLTQRPAKPFIVSVTGSVFGVAACCTHLLEIQKSPEKHRWRPDAGYADLLLMMEVNLSCPNIAGEPPPAYDAGALGEYITCIGEAKSSVGRGEEEGGLHVGIKTPPYTYSGQFEMLVRCLEDSTRLAGGCPISFITAMNTLGNCLVLDGSMKPVLGSANGSGVGGMGGDALHPLALGNVRTLRTMLDASPYEELHRIAIIGVGGVRDDAGFNRMMSVGASAVGVGTALGREGVGIFEKISNAQVSEFVNL